MDKQDKQSINVDGIFLQSMNVCECGQNTDHEHAGDVCNAPIKRKAFQKETPGGWYAERFKTQATPDPTNPANFYATCCACHRALGSAPSKEP